MISKAGALAFLLSPWIVQANFSIDSTGLLRWQGGYVCDDLFNANAGKMICNTVYDKDFKEYSTRSLPNGSRDFRMDNLNCPENADRLSDCTHTAVHDCFNSEGVYLECQPRSFSIQGGLLKYGDGWVCDDNFGFDEARMACRAMNMKGGNYYTGQTVPRPYFTMDDLDCPNGASDRSQCTYNKNHNCNTGEGVRLECHNCCEAVKVSGVPSQQSLTNGVYYMTDLKKDFGRPVYRAPYSNGRYLYSWQAFTSWRFGTNHNSAVAGVEKDNDSKFFCPADGSEGTFIWNNSDWVRSEDIKIECVYDDCYEHSIDYYGGDLESMLTGTAYQCQQRCMSRGACTKWTWAKNSGRCYVKNNSAGRRAHGSTVSGPKYCNRSRRLDVEDAAVAPDVGTPIPEARRLDEQSDSHHDRRLEVEPEEIEVFQH